MGRSSGLVREGAQEPAEPEQISQEECRKRLEMALFGSRPNVRLSLEHRKLQKGRGASLFDPQQTFGHANE